MSDSSNPSTNPTPTPNPKRQNPTQCDSSDPRVLPPETMEILNKPILSLATPSPFDPLTVSSLQFRVIALILQGLSFSKIARKLSVHRSTLYRWKDFHPGFIAELGRQRKEFHQTARQHLSSLLTRSLKVVAKDLSSQDRAHRLSAARIIISHCAPRSTAPDPDEATHPHDVIDPIADHLRKELGGDAFDGLPLSDYDRQQALNYFSNNLAAPRLEADPS